MLILSCSTKLQLLEGILRRGLPETLLVHGAVMNINRRNPARLEVLVDSWPEFKVILTRPCREAASDNSDFYTNTYAVYYQDLGACHALMGSAINWDQAFRIYVHGPSKPPAGLHDGPYEASRDIAETKGAKLDMLRYFIYFHPDPSSMPEIRLDPAVRLSSLDLSHVDLLNETWLFGGNDRSRKYLASLIRHFPSACLLDATGHPVSWMASDAFGAMRSAYTLPQHRGRGYTVVLGNVMAKRLHALGYPSYGHVAMENVPMQRLQEKVGCQRHPSLCHFIWCNAALDRYVSPHGGVVCPAQRPRELDKGGVSMSEDHWWA